LVHFFFFFFLSFFGKVPDFSSINPKMLFLDLKSVSLVLGANLSCVSWGLLLGFRV
jgi:hypothetical protein